VRSGIDRGWSVLGVADGYAGLITGSFRALGDRDVGGIHLCSSLRAFSRVDQQQPRGGREPAL
jgi:6-phosphofructokinase